MVYFCKASWRLVGSFILFQKYHAYTKTPHQSYSEPLQKSVRPVASRKPTCDLQVLRPLLTSNSIFNGVWRANSSVFWLCHWKLWWMVNVWFGWVGILLLTFRNLNWKRQAFPASQVFGNRGRVTLYFSETDVLLLYPYTFLAQRLPFSKEIIRHGRVVIEQQEIIKTGRA